MSMRVTATIKDDLAEWDETYTVMADSIEDAEAAVQVFVDRFNETLRPNEKPRSLLQIKVVKDNQNTPHQWYKTNLITIDGRDGFYDTYRCKECGVTGRRYGFSETIKRDRGFRAKKYAHCDWRSA
jgi:hypothetical protein